VVLVAGLWMIRVKIFIRIQTANFIVLFMSGGLANGTLYQEKNLLVCQSAIKLPKDILGQGMNIAGIPLEEVRSNDGGY
jgi:hypothetical protein